MVRRCWGLLGQRGGPGRVVASPFSGGTDRSRSVTLGSGAEVVVLQRHSSSFRWRSLASSIGLWLWRSSSDRGSGDLERVLAPIWSGFVLRWAAWCWGWFWSDMAVLQWKASARRLVAAGRRFGGDGACRRRVWLSAVLGLCGGLGVLGRATVLGPLWCLLLFFNLVFCYLFSVVLWFRISPPSVKRGFRCFQVASMPLFWYLGCTVVPSLWLGLLAVPAVYQCDDELPLHVVWRFWDTVLERVLRFIFILVAGLYLYTRVKLLPMVARMYGRIWWLEVGLVWLTEVGLVGRSATMVLVWKGCCGLIPHMVTPGLCNMFDY